MSAREPDFIQAQAREAQQRYPAPLFDLHCYEYSHPGEVTLKNPMQWIVIDEVFEAIPRSFFTLIEQWWYPVVASNNPDDTQKFVHQQMRSGYPLFAVYDPKDRELCWQINSRYFLANRIEFDVLAFRGNLNDARIVMWLIHAGHLELIPLTDYTSRV